MCKPCKGICTNSAWGLKNISSAAHILGTGSAKLFTAYHYADYKIKAAMSHLQILPFHLRYCQSSGNYSNWFVTRLGVSRSILTRSIAMRWTEFKLSQGHPHEINLPPDHSSMSSSWELTLWLVDITQLGWPALHQLISWELTLQDKVKGTHSASTL